MKDRIFAMSSLTYAYKGKDTLYRYGIRSDIVRLSGKETRKGCRYGVAVRGCDFDSAHSILLRCGAIFSEII